MILRLPKHSLSIDYLTYVLVILLTTGSIATWFSWNTYQEEISKKIEKLPAEAAHVDYIFSNSIDYIASYAEFISEKIAMHGAGDLDYISSLMEGKFNTEAQPDNLFISTLFDWVTPNKKMLVSSGKGILPKPIDMSHRSYLSRTALYPFTVQFSDPAIGIPSGIWLIPAGMGVTDKKGKYLGAVTMGFTTDGLAKKIIHTLGNTDLSFIILTVDSFKLVVNSAEDNSDHNTRFFIDLFGKEMLLQKGGGMFAAPVDYNNLRFFYYKKIAKYPYVVLVGYSKSMQKQLFNTIVLPRIIEFSAIGSVFAFLLYLVRKRFISPILELSRSAEILSQGKQDVPISEYSIAEIATLAKQLQRIQMLIVSEAVSKEEVRKAHSELQEINSQLEEKVRLRTLELQKSLDAKTEFLNNMSHEIKTPLHTLMTVCDELASSWSDYSNQDRYKYFQDFQRNTRRLYDLLMNLLDLSNIQSNKMSYDMKYCNLIELIDEIIKECTPLAENKNLKLIFPKSIAFPKCKVMGDPVRLMQVLRNLVVNAIRYSEKGVISAELTAKQIERPDGSIMEAVAVMLRDEGKGIPEQETESIFGIFYQSSRTKTKAGGTGLGLAICREIIKAHQGTIWAENNANGVGSTFTFVIPTASEDTDTADEITENNSGSLHEEKTDRTIQVLMIDDEPSCLNSMELMLFKSNYNLIKAEGGHAGLECLKNHADTIDVVLLDLMMPDVYGLNVLATIRETPSTQHLPVILQSGTSDTNEIAKARELGIVDLLPKPYSRKELFAVLEKIKGVTHLIH